jgi:hypothetical protein
MTDPTLADEIAAVFREEAAPAIADAFHADTCEILRSSERVKDGMGGYTEEPSVIRTVRCRLDGDTRTSRESATGAVIVSAGSYTVELPYDVDINATDHIRIDGRTFEVIDPRKGGAQDLFRVIGVEERS